MMLETKPTSFFSGMPALGVMSGRLILLVLLPSSAALFAYEPPMEEAPPKAELQGVWPSEKLLKLVLQRWADDASRQFELDDRQREQVTKDVVERWSRFLGENRPQLQPLFNEFIEMRMDLKPPSKEQVMDWSQRAQPAFEKAREQVKPGTEDFRKILTPGQRIKFEIEAAKFNAGMLLAEQQLQRWRKGEFDEDDFWEPTRSERQRRRAEKRQKEHSPPAPPDAGGKAGEEDAIAEELKAWDTYVGEFITNLRLNEGQRLAALSCLEEMKQRALGHRDTRREEITQLETKIRGHAGSKEELNEIKRELTVLYGPIDEMFQELTRRLEAIPSVSQRSDAPLEQRGGSPSP